MPKNYFFRNILKQRNLFEVIFLVLNIFFEVILVFNLLQKSIMKDLPDINEIKLLEKNAQKKGSGILYEQLLGIWKFKYVWGKESDEVKIIPSSILQVLSARLELRSKNKEDQINYEIKNSINFGLLNITFIGSAELKGLRPLLAFYFEELKISISSFLIFNKELKKPEEKKMPFFSLVGISTKDNWLCARGRGGGLAIWVKS